MENVDLEIWWSSLPVSEKERIARKGLSKAGDPDESKACYPACTVWWNSLEEEHKAFIYKAYIRKKFIFRLDGALRKPLFSASSRYGPL